MVLKDTLPKLKGTQHSIGNCDSNEPIKLEKHKQLRN
jgi:hypothetical protein